MESKGGQVLIVTGVVIVAIALFVRLFIAVDLDTITELTARRVTVFTQVLLAGGCTCVATGMLRRSNGFGEPVVRAAYVVASAALLIAVLARSL